MVDAGVARVPRDAFVDPTEECLKIGEHVAQLEIDNAKDAPARATLEQERTNIVLKVSQGCTRVPWSAELRECHLRAKQRSELEPCMKMLKAGG